MPATYSPKQIADRLGLSGTTIRNYSRLWSDYLSPAANPQVGQPRQYSEDDLAVIATIATLRDNQATTDQIREALDGGQRLEPVRPLEEDRPAADRAGQSADHDQQAADHAANRAAAETAIAIYRDRLTAVEARADQLADRLIAAESRAAAAERELEILRELHAAADPGRKMTFWEWVQQRRK